MSRQLESDVTRTSAWQKLYVGMFFLLTGVVLLSADIPWDWHVVIIIAFLILYLISTLKRDQLLHITARNIDDSKSDWQLLYKADKGRKDPVLWEAKLVNIQGFRHCIQFTFQTSHPLKVSKSVMLWQDQISASSWRRFKVLANWR